MDWIGAVTSRDRYALGVWIGIHTRQTVGIVCQAFLINTLLDVIGCADPDSSIILSTTRVDPIITIGIDVIVITAEEDLASFRDSEHSATRHS